jgi:hypothetical protein
LRKVCVRVCEVPSEIQRSLCISYSNENVDEYERKNAQGLYKRVLS